MMNCNDCSMPIEKCACHGRPFELADNKPKPLDRGKVLAWIEKSINEVTSMSALPIESKVARLNELERIEEAINSGRLDVGEG